MKYKIVDEDWFEKPSMMGERLATKNFLKIKEIIDKYGKSDIQKEFISYVIRDSTDWHYWCYMDNRSISQFRYVLRRIDNGDFCELLRHYNENSGLLKGRFNWALEVLSYTYDREAYAKNYVACFGFYGLKKDAAISRMNEYFEKLLERDDLREFLDNIIDINNNMVVNETM